MAVRADASGDFLTRTTVLPPIASFTVMGWFYITTRVAWGALIWIGGATYGNAYSWSLDATGNSFSLWNVAADNTGAATPATGTWFHGALVCDGTGAGNLRTYVNGVLAQSIAGNASAAAGNIRLLGDIATPSQFFNGRVDNPKVFNVALTAAEILNEMQSIVPSRLANCVGWSPTFPGATERLLDLSGAGVNWTAGGTLTDEDPPPVSWRGKKQLISFVSAGAPAALNSDASTPATQGRIEGSASAAAIDAATTSGAAPGGRVEGTSSSAALDAASASGVATQGQPQGSAASNTSDLASGSGGTSPQGSGAAATIIAASASGAVSPQGSADASSVASRTADASSSPVIVAGSAASASIDTADASTTPNAVAGSAASVAPIVAAASAVSEGAPVASSATTSPITSSASSTPIAVRGDASASAFLAVTADASGAASAPLVQGSADATLGEIAPEPPPPSGGGGGYVAFPSQRDRAERQLEPIDAEASGSVLVFGSAEATVVPLPLRVEPPQLTGFVPVAPVLVGAGVDEWTAEWTADDDFAALFALMES